MHHSMKFVYLNTKFYLLISVAICENTKCELRVRSHFFNVFLFSR